MNTQRNAGFSNLIVKEVGNTSKFLSKIINYGVPQEVKISPLTMKTFYLHALANQEDTRLKYNGTLEYAGVNYTIDPFFNTTNSTFTSGTFNRTEHNATGFVQLNNSDSLQELPAGGTTDIFLGH